MRTICAPSYANIFISEFEEKYVYSLIKNKSVIYLRYIDDIFKAKTKSESELRQYLNQQFSCSNKNFIFSRSCCSWVLKPGRMPICAVNFSNMISKSGST